MRKRGLMKGRKRSTDRYCTYEIWLTSNEVARLEGISRVAVCWRCQHGLYQKVKKVKAHGGGSADGMMWLIALSNPKISRIARHLFHLRRIIIPELKDIIEGEMGIISAHLLELEKMILALREDVG